ncbi:SIS domain-containing protein [Sphaerisporangium album]|uniref:SIS domain-containing protein n=1 Tax=Sphaerisporangium album TaxID=509200 RepID=A0A367FS36_9ACTN|nr:PfkB family carbohydrate kinase [Sphaerisporangium album]RCG32507.1 SIS domain-containing protein [Sphaerisporangium album]
MPPTGTEGARRVLVIGNLTIDDVVRPDGTVRMASPGGNVVYAALAARLWNPVTAVVTRRGDDLPPGILETLGGRGVDTSAVRAVEGPTVRNWVVYEDDGRRHWIYRTPRERSAQVAVRPGDLPEEWLRDGPVVHVAAMPLPAAAALVEHVRAHAPGALITLDTHEDWADRDAVMELAARCDVFVPSREELAALAGFDDPVRAVALLRERGVPAVVVKLGGDGALVGADGMPAPEAIPARPARVADTTGAGDTFCGALAAALASGLSLPEAARRGVATAAWAVEDYGSLALAGLTPEDARRRYAAEGGEAAVTGMDAASEPAGDAAPGLPAAVNPVTSEEAPYDIDVMRREIAMIPEVIAQHLDDPGGHVARVARALGDWGIEHVFLVGCGDSHFAGLATALAFQRHTGVHARAVHALDFARYQVRYLPERSAVVCVSFSGKVGRTTEAAIQARRFGHLAVALTNNESGALAEACDLVLPISVPTLGFSPGTSTYLGMVATLDDLALRWAGVRRRDTTEARAALRTAPGLAERTLRENAGPADKAARVLAEHEWITFLGAGPNESSAKFGAAKLFEGPQLVGVSTNLEEWAHEEYFVTGQGTPVVLVAPSGAGADRAAEILDEIGFIGAHPIVVSDAVPRLPAVHLPLAAGLPEEFSPLLAALPLSLIGFHLAEVLGKKSYNFPSEAARTEHYDTIHRVVIGEPA